MSGFEVAGLVLGVLPLAIKAVDSYMTVFSSYKTAQDDLKWLKWNLETEKVVLQNTCEQLLHEIAPYDMIHSMIKHPFGPDWTKYNDKLRLRLWSSWGIFREQIDQLSKATAELEEKLCLGRDGSIRLERSKKIILRELKDNTTFSLKKKDYEELLRKIQSSNERLQGFVRPDNNLISTRRRWSQSRVINLFRGLSRSIFTAMHNAVTCKCEETHNIGIELAVRSASLLPDEEEDEVASRFQYDVVMDSTKVPAVWNRAKLQLDGTASMSTEKARPEITVRMPTKQPRKRVTWRPRIEVAGRQDRADTSSAVQTLIQSSSTVSALLVPTSSFQESASPIANLCQVFHGKRKALSDSECYGHIMDTGSRRFRLSPPPSDEPSKFSHTVTLRDLLSGPDDVWTAFLPKFDHEEKFQLALTLANSILYTYNTPWLAQSITLNDINFLLEPDEATPRDCYRNAYRPFITKAVSLSNCNVSPTQVLKSQRMINTTLLSLGVLLIQIITGTVEESLDIPTTIGFEEVYARRESVRQLETRVIENGGMNYAKVVSWCFDKAIGLAGFQNVDGFCQEFYETVIGTLERELEVLRE